MEFRLITVLILMEFCYYIWNMLLVDLNLVVNQKTMRSIVLFDSTIENLQFTRNIYTYKGAYIK